MGRKGYRAEKIRKANEFDIARLIGRLYPPNGIRGVYAWTLADIRDARDKQLAGHFERPARLVESMRTDDALFTAYCNRLAPQRCIGVEISPANSSSDAKRVAREAEALFGAEGIGVKPETLSDINGCLANHSVAFGHLTWTPRSDGSRIDVELNYWPIDNVYWDSHERSFMTRTHAGPVIPITHGDGRWVVFAKHEHEPWKQEACVLPGALLWARHAFAARDWAKGSASKGNSKILGTMPEGIALQDADGNPTEEAAALLAMLESFVTGDSPVGIAPFGAKVESLSDMGTNWQIFSELMLNAEKAAARIYLGTDGTLGSAGGAPGVDIAALFGVATTKVQGDLTCITKCLRTGVIEPWTAVNFGDSKLAPRRRYLMPDADANAEREAFAKRHDAFQKAVKEHRENGFVLDQATVNALAKRFAVPAPTIATTPVSQRITPSVPATSKSPAA